VDLTPVLVSGVYFDADNDDHFQSQWQISTESDFSTLVLDETSKTQLTAYTVGEMVLDVDTEYYWRVTLYRFPQWCVGLVRSFNFHDDRQFR
jgi:hypothetical protein